MSKVFLLNERNKTETVLNYFDLLLRFLRLVVEFLKALDFLGESGTLFEVLRHLLVELLTVGNERAEVLVGLLALAV